MTITDSARQMLQDALTESGNDCLLVKLEKSCCGTSLFFHMEKLTEESNRTLQINGIPVVMDQVAIDRTAGVTIDFKDGELVMDDPDASHC